MGPFTLAVDTKSSSKIPTTGEPNRKMRDVQLEPKMSFATITACEEKPFNFLRTLFEGVVAGGAAGVVVETALYPIDTIKTRLQGFCPLCRCL